MTKKEFDIINSKRYVLIGTSDKNNPDIVYGELYNEEEPNACILAFISMIAELIIKITPSRKNDISQYNIHVDRLINTIRKGIKAAIDLKFSIESNKKQF